MVLRRIARPLLAAIFVSGGVNALRSPEGHAEAAGPLLDRTLGRRADTLPEAVPTDPVTVVKLDAAVKIAAGSALALGKLPRISAVALLASLVPTTAAAHRFWEESDPAQRQEQLVHFLKNAGLAGGLVLAVADNGGKPSLGWRARRAARKAGKQVEDARTNVRTARELSRSHARRAGKRARKHLGTS